MAAGSTYTPIATTTLGSAASSYTFSSIPSTYTDLVLVANRAFNVDGGYYLGLRFNGDSGNNYSITILYSQGSSGYSTRESNINQARIGNGSTVQGNTIAQIQNYSNSTTYKTTLSRDNATNEGVRAYVSLWRNTAAITSVEVISQAGSTMNAGTVLTLYGIAAA